jgi:hypothetical protein
MLFAHSEHPGRTVRLAYCLNLHPAEDLDGVLSGMRRVTLPLAERLRGADADASFGVGLWLPASVALALASDAGAAELERLLDFLAAARLDPFTFNAFPYGGFHSPGLKERVFRPTWQAPERLAYTLAVATIAARARARLGGTGGHVSISTHAGGFGAWFTDPGALDACAENLALAALSLARLEETDGLRVVLALEPEPRSAANDTRALTAIHERVRVRAREVLGRGFGALRDDAEGLVARHVGTCLDACHAAVEFEPEDEAFANATAAGTPLGKLQFSSALALAHPDDDAQGRAELLALDEPVYLHQVTGRKGEARPQVVDLPELRAALAAGEPRWQGCEEWRCHFHVPVDRARFGRRLGTTRAVADALFARALATPDRWGSDELHVEIETYTWELLEDARASPDALRDGLAREYAWVLAQLDRAGWKRA